MRSTQYLKKHSSQKHHREMRAESKGYAYPMEDETYMRELSFKLEDLMIVSERPKVIVKSIKPLNYSHTNDISDDNLASCV